jgi:hypothetical protein
VLLLHEDPVGNDPDQLGNAAIKALLQRRTPSLTLCGHAHWPEPITRLGTGHIINVDARAVVLIPDPRPELRMIGHSKFAASLTARNRVLPANRAARQ